MSCYAGPSLLCYVVIFGLGRTGIAWTASCWGGLFSEWTVSGPFASCGIWIGVSFWAGFCKLWELWVLGHQGTSWEQDLAQASQNAWWKLRLELALIMSFPNPVLRLILSFPEPVLPLVCTVPCRHVVASCHFFVVTGDKLHGTMQHRLSSSQS